jgi:hypothetical protein
VHACKDFDDVFKPLWDRCNVVIFGWIINSISKDFSSGLMYIEDAFLAWKDLKERFDKVSGQEHISYFWKLY